MAIRKKNREVIAPPRSGRRKKKDANVVEVAGVRISNPDRVLDVASGITKLDVARYLDAVSEWMIPHVRQRPTTLVRCPEGLAGDCFYQKHLPYWAPEALERVEIQESQKVGEYLVANDVAGLIAFAQLGILEIHTWNSRAPRIEHPDRIVIDLDPDEKLPWKRIVDAALLVKEAAEHLGLQSFVKTTGGKGLHVVIPHARGPSWDESADFARALSEAIAAADPTQFTTNMSKAKRKNRIFIDHLRNVRGATSVAAFSTRAKPGLPVSTPISWDELKRGVRSDAFNPVTVLQRLQRQKTDPWADSFKLKQRLTRSMRRQLGLP